MKKTKILIGLTIFFILLTIGLTILVLTHRDSYSADIEEYTLHYYNYISNSEYDVVTKPDYIYVTKNRMVVCNNAPCNPIYEKDFKVKYKDEYVNLFKELFKDEEKNEKSISSDDLTDEQKTIFNEIVKDTVKDELAYRVLETSYHSTYTTRGYYVFDDEEDGSSIYIMIASGEKNSSGYTIDVEKVVVKGEDVTIYVSEKTPQDGTDGATATVMTQPVVKVEFNKMPSKITVINKITNEEYNRIN